MKQLAVVALAAAFLAACTWVKPTPEGAAVRVASASETRECVKLGKVNVSVKHNVARMERKPEKVATELETLARNEAAEMDGDTVVAQGKAVDGRQGFGVYRCQAS